VRPAGLSFFDVAPVTFLFSSATPRGVSSDVVDLSSRPVFFLQEVQPVHRLFFIGVRRGRYFFFFFRGFDVRLSSFPITGRGFLGS